MNWTSGSALPALKDRQLPYHRREVRGRATGRLKVRQAGLARMTISVERSLPRQGATGTAEADLVEKVVWLEVYARLFCQPTSLTILRTGCVSSAAEAVRAYAGKAPVQPHSVSPARPTEAGTQHQGQAVAPAARDLARSGIRHPPKPLRWPGFHPADHPATRVPGWLPTRSDEQEVSVSSSTSISGGSGSGIQRTATTIP